MTNHEYTAPAVHPVSGIRQFGTILCYELKGCLFNKIFIGFTIFMIAAIAVITFFPRIWQLIDGSSSSKNPAVTAQQDGQPTDPVPEQDGQPTDPVPDTDEELPVMLVSSNTAEHTQLLQESFPAAFADYQVEFTDISLDEIKSQILEEKAACAFVLDSLTSYAYYVKDLSMHDQNTTIANGLLSNIYSTDIMMRAGMTAEEAASVLAVNMEHKTVNLGKDQAQNFFYTYIMIFALYFVILLYGQMITTNVATEKSSRAMELLITSAKPVSMMFGKVIASCLAGLTQLLAIFGSAFLFFQINASYWDGNQLISSLFGMPMWLLVYMLVFFVLGFLIYAFLYGAIGSTVSRLEDVNTAVMPVTMLFVIAFFITMMALANGTVDSMLMKVCSYIPFTSPMAMFTRLAMSTVPSYEIAVSIGVLILSVIGVGVVSAKIYRVGVLLYGTKPKMGAVLKAMRKV